MLSDLARMYPNGPAQFGGRVVDKDDSSSPLVTEQAFFDEHKMSRADYAERERIWAQNAWEDDVCEDLGGQPPAIDTPPGLTPTRAAYWRFRQWMAAEYDKLEAAKKKKADLQALIDAPAAAESGLAALVRRTADRLLNGLPADESDAAKRLELETQNVAARHKAEAAALVLSDVENELEIALLRCRRLREREYEFLNPAMLECGEGAAQLLAKKRAEVAALERLVKPLIANYAGYGQTIYAKSETAEIKWKGTWRGIADALTTDAAADVSKLVPVLKF
jgi:hypothetical protein